MLLRGPEPHHDAEALIAALQRIRSALVKAPAPAVPDGWKLVPVEPTGEWLSRARHWIDRYSAGIDDEPQLDRIYSELPTPSQPLVRGQR